MIKKRSNNMRIVWVEWLRVLIVGGLILAWANVMVRWIRSTLIRRAILAEMTKIAEWFMLDYERFDNLLSYLYQDAYHAEVDVITFTNRAISHANGPIRIRIDRNEDKPDGPNFIELRALGITSLSKSVFRPMVDPSSPNVDCIKLQKLKQ